MPRPISKTFSCRTRQTRRILILLAAALLQADPSAQAADPQPYTVHLAPTGEPALDSALHDSASLITLQTKAPVGPFALLTRAREDQARLKTALGSFGRYNPTVAIRIAGRDIDDPTLPAALDAATASVPVDIAVTLGPQTHLGNLALAGPPGRPLDGAILAQLRTALALQPGTPVRAADVLAAGARLLESLRNTGHALAAVSDPVATLDPAAHALNIVWTIDPGPRVDLGPIAVDGLQRVDASYVRRRLLIHQGDPYDPKKIEAARQDLASQGVFSTVRLRAAPALDPAGQLPITIDVVESPRHVVGATASYSTDLGASAGVTFTHRNLFGHAEKLDLAAAITQLGGSASRGQGYNVTAALTRPDVLVRDQSVTVSLQAIKESLDAYDRTAVLAGLAVSRRLSPELTVSAGLQGQRSRITQEGTTRDYSLLALPLGLKYDTTGPGGLFEPIHGIKAALTVTPTTSLPTGNRGNTGVNFTIIQLGASTYLDPGVLFGAAPGRSIVALRGIVGTIQGATTFQLPPDERFYAGGSGTVRGYKYQSVGPRFAADLRPTGGTSLAAASVEYRQRILGSFGAVIFADAGQVGTTSSPFGGQLRAGAGVGARYFTAIGPIRLDVAVPLNRQRGDDAFELYIGIGEAF